MPYIITTRDVERPFDFAARSRQAVATLDEAQDAVAAAMASVEDANPVGAGQSSPYNYALAWDLPESGGTIGPLPDGTVIEVERVSWSRLAEHTTGGWDAERGRFRAAAYDADIIAAFNSR